MGRPPDVPPPGPAYGELSRELARRKQEVTVMQARLQVHQFPTRAAAAFAVAAAVLGSGVLGYSIRTAPVLSGPARIIQVSSEQPAGTPDDCSRTARRNLC